MVEMTNFDFLMEIVVHGFEIAGVAVLVLGALAAFFHAAWSARRLGARVAYRVLDETWDARSCRDWSC